ncbi:MAG: nucleotidyltransferase family protein [bacterium]|nr:nucleotidyltransferase family protein [bacterium]
MEIIYNYTIQLIRYVLTGDKPELSETIDFETLYSFAESHGVENMVYAALTSLGVNVPKETMDKFEEANDMAIANEAMQALELEMIGERFEAEGIDYVPLKGSVIKYLYPDPSYRKSGDIDILIRPEDEKLIDQIMVKLGYERETEHDDHEVHFSYRKMPNIEVEVHRQLTRNEDRSAAFFRNPWEYVNLKDGYSHLYQMDNEYLYVYLLAHLCKHLYLGGAGIRLISDMYIMSGLKYDEAKLNEYLQKANLERLRQIVDSLCSCWFGDGTGKESVTEVLENIVLTGGSFGNKATEEALKVNDTYDGRVRILINKVFLSKKEMRHRYAALSDKNYPWIVMWCYRIYYLFKYKKWIMKQRMEETFSDMDRDKAMTELVTAIRDK